MAAPAAAGERIVLAAAGDFGLVDLDQAGERVAAGRDHAAAQLGAEQPGGLVGAQAELALQLQGRDAVGMGGHQIGRPEPGGQRQLGVVHDGPGGHRGLLAAAGAFPGPRLGLQFPRFARAAAGADKALAASAPRRGISTQAASSGKRCWNSIKERGKSVIAAAERVMFVICSITNRPRRHNIVCPGRTGISPRGGIGAGAGRNLAELALGMRGECRSSARKGTIRSPHAARVPRPVCGRWRTAAGSAAAGTRELCQRS